MNKETWKNDHLAGLHKGKESEYASWCKLCDNYDKAVKNNTLSAEPLGVDIRIHEQVGTKDIFGKKK